MLPTSVCQGTARHYSYKANTPQEMGRETCVCMHACLCACSQQHKLVQGLVFAALPCTHPCQQLNCSRLLEDHDNVLLGLARS